MTEFDNATRDPDTKTYPFAQLPKKVTYTVKNVNDGTGREFRSITTNGYEVRRFATGTYTVEQRHATTNRAGTPSGRRRVADAAHRPPPRPATTISVTPTWSGRPPRTAARSPRTSTTATTPPPG